MDELLGQIRAANASNEYVIVLFDLAAHKKVCGPAEVEKCCPLAYLPTEIL
jgi:hypothetical protein